MKKNKFSFSLLSLTCCLFSIFFIMLIKPSSAAQIEANNIFGIHLAQPHREDLINAAKLVNGNGGDWGYVTLVIQEDDRQKEKWQEVFNQLRELHLIPIIRIATRADGEKWEKPSIVDADGWASFLASLNWVVKNRYVVLFNEPNHSNEWGGVVDPKEYAQLALEFAKKLKEKNPDFFVMMAGLDASAPHQPPIFWDEYLFLKEVFQTISVNDFEKYFDGWASHSYPNPDFSASPYRLGRGSLYTYQWEKQIIRSFGVEKFLPVFITETGWRRSSFLSEQTIASYFQIAFLNIWQNDSQVWAVTPFILNYQNEPFLDFSWQKLQTNDFYSYYYTLQSLPKIKGEPLQLELGEIQFSLPKELFAHSQYQLSLTLKNQGQAIWDSDEGYRLDLEEKEKNHFLEIGFQEIKDIKPFEEKKIMFFLKTKNELEKEKIEFLLLKKDNVVLRFPSWSFSVLPLPKLTVFANYWPYGKANGSDFTIEIFDPEEKLVFQKKGVIFKNGQGEIKEIQNIILGELYRIVIIKKGFLPRQNYYVFKKEKNKLKFKPLLPFDRNGDGKFSLNDLWFF